MKAIIRIACQVPREQLVAMCQIGAPPKAQMALWEARCHPWPRETDGDGFEHSLLVWRLRLSWQHPERTRGEIATRPLCMGSRARDWFC